MKRMLIAATALTMLAGGAFAQTSSTSGSNATATNSSASQSASVSNPQVNVIGNPIGNGASSSTSQAGATANTRSNSAASAVGNRSNLRNTTNITIGGTGANGATDPNATTATGAGSSGNGDPTIHYSGGYTVRNTPEVIAPSVMGGNTCAVGASAGIAMPGFGLAGGATWADKACERRQQAALMYNMGKQGVAYALMCQDEHVREAMRVAGEPCPADAAVAAAAAAAPAPAIPAAPAARPAVVTTTAPLAPKPSWCSAGTTSPAHLETLSEGQRLYIRQQCGV